MMEGDDDELVMTREELRRWIKEKVKGKQMELLDSAAVQSSRLQSLLDRRERRQIEYDKLRRSVDECEAVVKDLYNSLGWEYKDTDSEDETLCTNTNDEAAVNRLDDDDVDHSDMPHLSPYDVIPSGSIVTSNPSVSKSQHLQTTGVQNSHKPAQRDKPSTSEDETRHKNTDDGAAVNRFDDDDAADNNMPHLSPSQHPQTARVQDSHKETQRDEASSTSLLANLKKKKKKAAVVLPEHPVNTVRRSLRSLQQCSYKEEVEENSEYDSDTQWEPKEDSGSSGSDWMGSDSESRSKKKRDEQTLTPKVNANIISKPVAPKTSYTAASKVTLSQTNIMTNGRTTNTSTTTQKLIGGNSCALVASPNPDTKPPKDLPEEALTVGMEVLARRKPNFWEKGKLTEIIAKDGVQNYEVDFGKKRILLAGHQIAFCHSAAVDRLYVGARVVAKYQEAESSWFDAGILVDLPNRKNRMRFLVFFDDHTPSYVGLTILHLVCRPLKDVCEDLTDEVHKNFIKDYLQVYPNSSLAVYRVGQSLNVDLQRIQRKCVVEQVDCQLIQVVFKDDEQKEWIYLGSIRLEYIVNLKKRLEKGTEPRKDNPPSTPQPMTSTQTIHPSKPYQTKPASIPVSAASTNTSADRDELPVAIPSSKMVKYSPHRCSPACLDRIRPKDVKPHTGRNPLLAPLFYEFHRMKARKRHADKESAHLYYRSPCGLSLGTMALVQDYLHKTRCDFLYLEMFCLDPDVFVSVTCKPLPSKVFILDISKGKERRQISCVNEINSDRAILPMYRKERVATDAVSINTSPDFLVGCDCTDGCRDSVTCSCRQLTVESTALSPAGPSDASAGYYYKRLYNPIVTGVYECNALCRCDPSMCSNRVVQNGILVRLQVFKTQNRGWGVRCLDDVAMGTFICTFSGRIQSSGQTKSYNTEYCVKLNHIEGAEVHKEDYETEAYCSDSESDLEKTVGPAKRAQGKSGAGSTAREKGPDKSTTSVTTIMTRHLFDGDDQCFVIDAGVEGNVARYFNHSCSPNMFVQNVFVDTHDLRFPWMAFFTNTLIKSGTELTWNYRSTVGGVENVLKSVQCHCGSENCHDTL